MQRPGALIALIPLLLPLACEDLLTDDRDIYAIASWTRNEVGCDVEGESVLETETDTLVATNFTDSDDSGDLIVATCYDDDSCASNTQPDAATGWQLSPTGENTWGWTGIEYGESTTSCNGARVTVTFITNADQRFVLEIRRQAFDVPFTDGACPDTLESDTAGEPCTSLEVLSGAYERTYAFEEPGSSDSGFDD